MSNLREEIGARVGALLRERNHREQFLAEVLDSSEASVAGKLEGAEAFSLDDLAKIAALYNVNFDWLIAGKADGEAEVSQEEQRLLRFWRSLSPRRQEHVFGQVLDHYREAEMFGRHD